MSIDPGDALTRVRESPEASGKRQRTHPPGAVAWGVEPAALSPGAALRWFSVAVVFALVAYAIAFQLKPHVVQRVPSELSPEALEARAHESLRYLGIGVGAHSARGLDYDRAILRHVIQRESGRERWENVGAGQPAAVFFWHRESAQPLLATTRQGVVTESDPALTEPDAVTLRLDTAGRLVFLQRIGPRDMLPLLAQREPDWSRLFREAGLEPSRFRRIEALFVPPVFADSRASWMGYYAARPEIQVRIDAAALHGRPVYFEIVGPWTLEPLRGFDLIGWELAAMLLLVAGLVLARRNLRLGRGDRRGALRLGGACFVLAMLQWLLQADHLSEPLMEWSLLQHGAAWALFWSGSVALGYVAIEPYLRGYWPRALDSWARLLADGPRRPEVARDVLIGLAAGYVLLVLALLVLVAPTTFGSDTLRLASAAEPLAFVGWRGPLAAMCEIARLALHGGLAAMTLLLLLRFALRRTLMLALAFVVLTTLLGTVLLQLWLGDGHRLDPLLIGAAQLLLFVLMTRVGLLATIASLVPVAIGFTCPPLGSDSRAWYAPSLLLPIAAQAALLGYAWLAALLDRSALSDEAPR
jgi:serine/threonine-protein kinase